MSEHNEQASLFQWVDYQIEKYPELEMLYAIPNGGKRHKKTAYKLKAEGVKAGVWDLSLDVPRGQYSGLKIEMKYGSNKLTENQKQMQRLYEKYSYKCAVCYSWFEAVNVILRYLGYPPEEALDG